MRRVPDRRQERSRGRLCQTSRKAEPLSVLRPALSTGQGPPQRSAYPPCSAEPETLGHEKDMVLLRDRVYPSAAGRDSAASGNLNPDGHCNPPPPGGAVFSSG